MDNNSNFPSLLLARYDFVVVKTKPQFLNTILKPCCYTAQNSYKIYKWKPNDTKFDKTNGETGKRIMKLKEHSGCCARLCLPTSCRGYDGYYVAEHNRKVVFMIQKPF